MLVTAYSFMMQVSRLVPRPWSRPDRTTRALSAGSGRGYGLCPVCREFVRIALSEPARAAAYPACGNLIGEVQPLWPVGPDDHAPATASSSVSDPWLDG
jgi:hypothetical protein